MGEVKGCPENFDPERLQPILVAGDTFQAILSAEYIPGQFKKEPIGSLFNLGFRDILTCVPFEHLQRHDFMDCDRTSRSPRLTLDEDIDFDSLKILVNHGLHQRCAEVYKSWRAERHRDDQTSRQRERDATVAGRKKGEAALVRIKNGIVKWLAEQAVTRYPCV